MEKEQGLGVLCRVFDEREEVFVDRERNVCALSYQLVVYQFQRSSCGSVICKGMIFLMSAVLSHIIFLPNKPYHFPNWLCGV